jgi:hypothetical protein
MRIRLRLIPFYALNSSGGRLTQDPAKAQCKFYWENGGSSVGYNTVTCQTTVGLP